MVYLCDLYTLTWIKHAVFMSFWYVYQVDSLKVTTRQKRGKGVRRRVAPTTAVLVPKNWKGFLRVDDNNTELISLISQKLHACKQMMARKSMLLTTPWCSALLVNLT